MDTTYRLDPAATELVASAHRVAREVAAAHAVAVDREGRFPRESLDALRDAGLMGLTVPAALGGRGQGARAFVAVVEELAQACGSTAMVYVMHVCGAQSIASSTTLAGKDQLLRDIAAGRHLTTLALSEKGSRSNFWAPSSSLAEAAGGFVTSAEKSWVTSAREADSYVASARRPGAKAPLESTGYLVRKGAAGMKIAGAFDGLGLRGNDSAPVTLDGVRLAAGDLMTAQGEGAKLKLEVVLPWFVLGTSAMAAGLSLAATAATAEHLGAAKIDFLAGALRDLPQLRARIGAMAARTAAARALLGRLLDEMEAGAATTPLTALQTRLTALECAVDVTDGAMKACGGAAFSRHLPVERLFRDARAGWVMAPTVDHLQDFIGKAVTGLPLF